VSVLPSIPLPSDSFTLVSTMGGRPGIPAFIARSGDTRHSPAPATVARPVPGGAARQTGGVCRGLLPTTARWAAGPVEPADLYAEERAAVAAAVPARMAEFAAGRAMARRALGELGVTPAPIPVGPGRRPVWPAGVTGSITHCPGLVAAAVARLSDLAALGIDAEPAVPLDAEVAEVVGSARERSGADAGDLGATVVFCAKEAFYKCWSTLGGPFLDFADVTVSFDGSSFVAIPPGQGAWVGRWAVRDGFVLAAAWREAS
jgi:4'-phosphopantetheinyl transferase EntD